MYNNVLLQVLTILLHVESAFSECFSCVSNSDWSFYSNRIPGLKNLNDTLRPPVAPIACAFDPMRIYADRNAVACKGYCVKWSSVTILQDGGLEVNILRGCWNIVADINVHPAPGEGKCYQEPHDFNHRIGQEYRTTCFCKGFMCNDSDTSSFKAVVTLMIASLLLRY